MMNTKNNPWEEEIIHSMQGSQRAQPPADLFQKIERKLDQRKKVMPLFSLKWIAVAACLVLGFNVFGFISAKQMMSERQSQNTEVMGYQGKLFSNYNPY